MHNQQMFLSLASLALRHLEQTLHLSFIPLTLSILRMTIQRKKVGAFFFNSANETHSQDSIINPSLYHLSVIG